MGYRITVSNTGFVALTDVVISDAKINPGNAVCASVLPGQTCVLQGTCRVTEADARARQVVNEATVTDNMCASGSQEASCRVTLTTQVRDVFPWWSFWPTILKAAAERR